MTKPNMVKYLERLTENEKAVICFFANNLPSKDFDLPKTDFHLGLLPFLPRASVIHWCKTLSDHNNIHEYAKKYRRICLSILSKMQEDLEGETGTESFLMRLDDKKVYRRFGLHPERGKPLPFLPKQKVTVGMKWSLPKKTWVHDKDVLVSPCVQLKRIGASYNKDMKGMWSVTVNKKCRAAVEYWLQEHCSVTAWG